MLSPLLAFSPMARVWRDGRVVMQRPAKPCTSVRFRVAPPEFLAVPKCFARMVKLVDTRDLKSLLSSLFLIGNMGAELEMALVCRAFGQMSPTALWLLGVK